MSITATRVVPTRSLPFGYHLCDRCGIKHYSREGLTHCRDCRSVLKEEG